MPYLPPRVLEQTQFPSGDGVDLAQDIRLIEEAWRIHYPVIQYFQLDRRTTSVATDTVVDPNKISGEADASKFDVLWGESVDSTQTTWVQPQGTDGAVQAADVEVFKDPVALHVRPTWIKAKKELKKYGFDSNDLWVNGLVLSVPASMLDALTTTCSAGDKVRWAGDDWLVVLPSRSGRWKSTNLTLYVTMYCERWRHGS